MRVSVLVLLMIPGALAADFFGPPRFTADQAEFEMARDACQSTLTYEHGDEVISAWPEVFFYRSGGQCLLREGQVHCLTYLVSKQDKLGSGPIDFRLAA